MLEQQQTEEVPHAAFAVTPMLQAAPPDLDAIARLSPPAQILIARYLAQTGTAQVSETRARLETLTLAYSELDATPQQAVDAAIRHLEGERHTAALEAQQARQQAFGQRKRSRRARQSARPATLTALKLFGPGALAFAVMPLLMWACYSIFANISQHYTSALLMFMIFVLPVLMGTGIGIRARCCPGKGTFYAIAILIPFVAMTSELIGYISEHLHASFFAGSWIMGFVMALFWLPIGVAAAGLTGWARDAFARAGEAQSHKPTK